MVRVGAGDDRRARMKLQKRTVKLVGLHHTQVGRPGQAVRIEVAGDSAQKGLNWPVLAEDPGKHRRSSRLAMGAGHGQALPGIGNLPQQLSPLEHNPSLALSSKQLGMVGWNRRRINNPGRGGNLPCLQ